MAAVKSFAQSEPAQLEGLAHLEIGVHIPPGLATYPSKHEVRVIWGEEAALAMLINFLTDLDGLVPALCRSEQLPKLGNRGTTWLFL